VRTNVADEGGSMPDVVKAAHSSIWRKSTVMDVVRFHCILVCLRFCPVRLLHGVEVFKAHCVSYSDDGVE
jgi:hypothetical protein